MGVFKFLKNVGAKIFGKKKEEQNTPVSDTPLVFSPEEMDRQKEAELMALVNTYNLPLEEAGFSVNDDVVVIKGNTDSQANKEKIILVVGNVEGIAEVHDNILVESPEPEAVFYSVEKGDTLWKISAHHYGNGAKYMVIFEANKPMLEDPDKIYPGQVLRIPPLEGVA